MPVGGMTIVSRRAGLRWVSSRGGLMVVSFEVTSNDLWTSWNSWLFQSNGNVSVIFRQRAQGKTEGGKQKEKKRTYPWRWNGWKPASQLNTVS